MAKCKRFLQGAGAVRIQPDTARIRSCFLTIYKLLRGEEWRRLSQDGWFAGAPVDLADGYIHFSDGGTVEETAARHFAGVADVILVGVDDARLGDALRWEVSRGGKPFPHLYGRLDLSVFVSAVPLPLGADGRHVFPPLQP
jgi:uncharacterized protein (DUF952 family)